VVELGKAVARVLSASKRVPYFPDRIDPITGHLKLL